MKTVKLRFSGHTRVGSRSVNVFYNLQQRKSEGPEMAGFQTVELKRSPHVLST